MRIHSPAVYTVITGEKTSSIKTVTGGQTVVVQGWGIPEIGPVGISPTIVCIYRCWVSARASSIGYWMNTGNLVVPTCLLQNERGGIGIKT